MKGREEVEATRRETKKKKNSGRVATAAQKRFGSDVDRGATTIITRPHGAAQ